MAHREPLHIGVSGTSAHTPSVRAILRQIREEGAKPILLKHQVPNLAMAVQQDIKRLHALVLMGNEFDIDPKCYGAKCHPETKPETLTPKAKARGRYEDAMLKLALAARMPVLGICGGMQRINVRCGGTLHQHLPDLVGSHKHQQRKQGIAPHIPVVPIVIKEETLLADIACRIKMSFATTCSPREPKVLMENSLHHQAVDKIGEGLCVCAVTDTVRGKDGRARFLAEAIEADRDGRYGDQFILGVQWHPEFGASSLGQGIVQRLLAAAREFSRYRQQRPMFGKIHSVTWINLHK